jgi:phenylacetate-CoA ligase
VLDVQSSSTDAEWGRSVTNNEGTVLGQDGLEVIRMSSYWDMDWLELQTDPEKLERVKFARLIRALRFFRERSENLRSRFDEAGLNIDRLDSIESFLRIPNQPFVVSKEDERRSEQESLDRFGHPFGIDLCVEPERVVGITATSGTTGVPTFSYLFTEEDLGLNDEIWRRVMVWIGARPGDVVLHALGLSMWVVGVLGVRALLNVGLRPLPVGAEAGARRVLRMAERMHPRVLISTPSMAERLIDLSDEVLGDPVESLGIEILLCTGEPGAGLPNVRARLEREFGAKVYDAQLGAFGSAQVSCDSSEYQGLHPLTPDFGVGSLIEPGSLEPVFLSPGEVRRGADCATTLLHRARPHVKRSGSDEVEIRAYPCPCGRPGQRRRVLGRLDDMLILGGVNLYPSAVRGLVAKFTPEVSGVLEIVLTDTPPRVRPPLRVRVESAKSEIGPSDEELARRIEREAFELLRCRLAVELVPPGILERAVGKAHLLRLEGSAQ